MADISKSAAVVAGEASESDDDIDIAKGVSSISNEEQVVNSFYLYSLSCFSFGSHIALQYFFSLIV